METKCNTCKGDGEIEDNGPKPCPSCGGNGYLESVSRFDELLKITEQVLKVNNAGVKEIKVIASDIVTTDGTGLLFLSKKDFDEFKKIKDPTKL